MPTALASELSARAESIGAAAFDALGGIVLAGAAGGDPIGLRVHSVFSSTINLKVEGSDILVALSGPSGAAYPYTVSLGRGADFLSWPLGRGDRGEAEGGFLRIESRAAARRVDVRRARLRARPELSPTSRVGGELALCEGELASFQGRRGFDLRLAHLKEGARAESPMGEELRRSVLAFGAAALECRRLGSAVTPAALVPTASVRAPGGSNAVPTASVPTASAAALVPTASAAALVGRGGGLTPSGDDFLCGFMAAARCTAPKGAAAPDFLSDALCEAIGRSISSTGEISASLLRCAMREYWPRPLADLSRALALGLGFDSLNSLHELCGLGHSSGADIATGFLYGLRLLAPAGGDRTVSVT